MKYKDFVEAYRSGKIIVAFDQHVASHLVESPVADKHNKPAHYFFTYASFGLTFIAPILLLFINWLYAVGSFILGRMIWAATKNSAADFATQNMLEDEAFYNYAIKQNGVSLLDSQKNPING